MMELEYDADEVEICHLDSADVKNFGKGGAAVQDDGYDSDDGEGSGPGNVECRQS
jgi:hypothetical protein